MHLFIDNEFDDVSGEFDRKVENSVMNLFVWAVLLNRTEMAKIFWQIGDVAKFYLNFLNFNFMYNKLINLRTKSEMLSLLRFC
jgi:hypothetical protein